MGKLHPNDVFRTQGQRLAYRAVCDTVRDTLLAALLASGMPIEEAGLHVLDFMTKQEPGGQTDQMSFFANVGYAWLCWAAAGERLLRPTPGVMDLMKRTTPFKELPFMPELPFDAFYVDFAELDSGARLYHETSGWHAVEGVYVSRQYDEEKGELLRLCLVGEDKRPRKVQKDLRKVFNLFRDDVLVYIYLQAGSPLPTSTDRLLACDAAEELKQEFLEEVTDAVSLVINLLMLFNSSDRPIVTDVRTQVPKSHGKAVKLERQGYSSKSYLRLSVSLDTKKRIADASSEATKKVTGYDGPTHMALICGHFTRKWVLAPRTNDKVLDRMTRESGAQLHCVWRYVPPHRALRAGPEPKRNLTIVSL